MVGAGAATLGPDLDVHVECGRVAHQFSAAHFQIVTWQRNSFLPCKNLGGGGLFVVAYSPLP